MEGKDYLMALVMAFVLMVVLVTWGKNVMWRSDTDPRLSPPAAAVVRPGVIVPSPAVVVPAPAAPVVAVPVVAVPVVVSP
jgi:hypothetical protein